MAGQAVPSSAPAPQATVVVERPGPGLARGRYESTALVVGVLGAIALAVTLAFYARRLRRRQP